MAKKHELLNSPIAHGWAVSGTFGIYTGWWLSRKSAIAAHVYEMGFPVESKTLVSGQLTNKHRAAWKVCRRNGDRAVPVTIAVDSSRLQHANIRRLAA